MKLWIVMSSSTQGAAPPTLRVQPKWCSHMSTWLARTGNFPMRIRIIGWLTFLAQTGRVHASVSQRFRMALDQNDLVQRELLFDGVYEPDVAAFIIREISPNDVFFDIGANCGYFSLLAAANGCQSVVAFEPDPLSLKVLRHNLALNSDLARCITSHELALSNTEEKRLFHRANSSNSGRSGFAARDVVASFEVQTQTLDQLIARRIVPVPSVLKVDVEGHESAVFEGAKNTLSDPTLRAVIFEAAPGEHGLPADSELRNRFEATGFRIRQLGVSGYVETENYLALRVMPV